MDSEHAVGRAEPILAVWFQRNMEEVRSPTNIESSLNLENRLLVERLKASFARNMANPSPGNLPRAAVSVILKPGEGDRSSLEMLLVKRKEREGDPWSGHMAFPGGRFERQDGEILQTAVREAMEEAGINLRECELLGRLDEVVPSSLRLIRVLPFVVLAPENTGVALDNREIDQSFWVPISYFMDKKNISSNSIERFGIKSEVPSYRLFGQYVVWGLTFRIIQDLINRAEPMSQ